MFPIFHPPDRLLEKETQLFDTLLRQVHKAMGAYLLVNKAVT